MTQAMQMMVKEIIEKDLKIREIIEIMHALSDVLLDRKNVVLNIQKRFSVDDANEREKFARMISYNKEAEKEDYEEAEAVLRKYELDYDVDELLGTESW